jgi:protein SCO1/2
MDHFDSLTEPDFASLISSIRADPNRHHELTELLREDHPLYDQRGAATTVRMRGWILFTLSKVGLSKEALVFVLEELDTAVEPYLVAAAARAIRAYPEPSSSLAPFLVRSITNIRYRDDPVAFEEYGEFFSDSEETTPLHELFGSLQWLDHHARVALDELIELRKEPRGLSQRRLADLNRCIEAVSGSELGSESCCELPAFLKNRFSWKPKARASSQPIDSVVFEDQNNKLVTFGDFFKGRPTIAAFFYTRCDNPLKCSLTITKLARIQNLLSERGLTDQINTAAITYDPEFDSSERIRGYGEHRGIKTDAHHRMLRARDGIDSIRNHFKLGVNFIESLVNRHRVEIYILDERGRIARVFERIRWDEEEVVKQAVNVIEESSHLSKPAKTEIATRPRATSSVLGTLASVGLAFFPKCPICWAAYMSLFGIVGLDNIPYSPWLQPLLAVVMLVNLGSVWLRARSTGRMLAFYLASAGAVVLIASKFVHGLERTALLGVGLTMAASLISSLSSSKRHRRIDQVSVASN